MTEFRRVLFRSPTLLERISAQEDSESPVESKPLQSRLFAAVACRAKRDGLMCMSRAEFNTLWTRACGRCELTGISFSDQRLPGRVKRPWMPSVDRRDNKAGYELANCRLLCAAVNLALNEFGDEVLTRIAKGLLFKQPMRPDTKLYMGESVRLMGERLLNY